MTRRTVTEYGCPFCACHHHHLCRHAWCTCACALRDHRPGVELAAGMRQYETGETGSLEALASAWHRKDETS